MSVLFQIDKDAELYINERTKTVTIQLIFNPALGGCACSKNSVRGSYIPEITLGQPLTDAEKQFLTVDCQGVRVFYPSRLQIKEGYPHIRISLKRVLWWAWLELSGAKAIPIID